MNISRENDQDSTKKFFITNITSTNISVMNISREMIKIALNVLSKLINIHSYPNGKLIQTLEFRVKGWGLEFRVQGLEFRVQGFKFRVGKWGFGDKISNFEKKKKISKR